MNKEELLDIKIDRFEGPLDLLLYLIRKHEIDIYDINITKITEDYLTYINEMKKLKLEIAGEYIVMAATLIKIKAEFMLPRVNEEDEIEDPRQPLVDRLLEYQKIKKASLMFRDIENEARKVFGRNITLEYRNIVEEEDSSIVQLMEAFSPILQKGKSLTSYRMPKVQITISQKISELTNMIESANEVNLSKYIYKLKTMYEVILSFIAILEMSNKNLISIRQKEQFKDIWIRKY
ncbi:MAG: segregation/condensation protein A [candidate division WOR-3 bacterium]|nr:segregation/condensation protein A [candidate division WOR-3 bacterium]